MNRFILKTSFHCLLSFTFVTFFIHWPFSLLFLVPTDVDPVLFVLDLHMKYTVVVVTLCTYIAWFVIICYARSVSCLYTSLHSWWRFRTPFGLWDFFTIANMLCTYLGIYKNKSQQVKWCRHKWPRYNTWNWTFISIQSEMQGLDW